MAEFLQFAFSGLTVGAVYALVAVGFTLIYNASGVINFAQGEFVMLGGMATCFWPPPAFRCRSRARRDRRHRRGRARAASAGDRAGARRQHAALIIITIGASIFLRAPPGRLRQALSQPAAVGRQRADPLGGAAIVPQSLVVLAGAAIIVTALSLFMRRTLFGKAIVATAANRLAARLVGINTRIVVGFSFAVSAAIGAIAGVLVTPITLTSYDAGTLLALKGFAAAMLGGIGSAPGAVVGGLLLGLLEQFSAGYVSSQYKDAVAFVVILIVLLARPQGLLGRAGVERV